MNRKLFLQTIGGIAALIPALRAKAAKPEVTLNTTGLDITQRDSPGWNLVAGEGTPHESFKTYCQLNAQHVKLDLGPRKIKAIDVNFNDDILKFLLIAQIERTTVNFKIHRHSDILVRFTGKVISVHSDQEGVLDVVFDSDHSTIQN